MKMTEEQVAQLHHMKACFPFRMAYGALNMETGEFVASAVPTKRIPNKLAREGWKVWVLA